MCAQLLYGNQYFTTTLNVGGGITNSQTTGIILADVSGVDTAKPGIALINYADPLNTTIAEWVEYTSINGSKELVTTTRGSEGFSAKAHSNGVAVAFPLSESHINRMAAKLDGTDTINSDLDLAAGVNIKTAGADPFRTIVLPSGSMSPTTTAGCASSATVESTTNKICYKTLDFDASTDENAFIDFNMPTSWDGGTFLVKFEWTAASGSGDVLWGIAGRAFANDDAIDQALGTAVLVTDTLTTALDVHITSETTAVTLAGTPAGGQKVYLQVYRDANAAGDTLAVDAKLKSVIIRYKVGQFSD